MKPNWMPLHLMTCSWLELPKCDSSSVQLFNGAAVNKLSITFHLHRIQEEAITAQPPTTPPSPGSCANSHPLHSLGGHLQRVGLGHASESFHSSHGGGDSSTDECTKQFLVLLSYPRTAAAFWSKQKAGYMNPLRYSISHASQTQSQRHY